MKKVLFLFGVVLCISGAGDVVMARQTDNLAKSQNPFLQISWKDVCQATISRETAIENALKAVTEVPPPTVDSLPPSPTVAVPIVETPAQNANETPAASAEELPTDNNTANHFFWPRFDRNDPRSKLEFGLEYAAYDYTEPDFAELEGNLWGIFANYDYRWRINPQVNSLKDLMSGTDSINLFRVETVFDFGKLKYSSNGTGEDNGVPNYSFELRGLLGYDIPFAETYQITPYMGLGYRYLLDDQGGRSTSTGASGYDRESAYVYLPIGMDLAKKITPTLTCRLNLEGDIFLGGKQKSHLEDVSSGFETLENDQKDGFGLRGSLRVTKTTPALDYFVEPFVRYWKISDSEISLVTYSGAAIGYGLEPENKTTEWGIRLGVRY